MKKSEFRSLIREEIKSILKEATGKGLEVIETGRKDVEVGDELEGGDFEITYDVKLNGKPIGKMEYGSYYGDIEGTLYGRRLPDIKDWTPVGVDKNKMYDEDGDMTPEGVKGKLIGFLKSKTGLKWLEVLKKQKPDAFMDAPELS